jgi:hypothetical protein
MMFRSHDTVISHFAQLKKQRATRSATQSLWLALRSLYQTINTPLCMGMKLGLTQTRGVWQQLS